jgi:hypothetical protein
MRTHESSPRSSYRSGHPSGPLVDLGWEPGLGSGLGLFEALGALVLGLVPYAYWS